MSFGRKGTPVGSEASPPPRAFGAAPATPAPAEKRGSDGLSPQARAFLEADRSRRGEEEPAPRMSAYDSAARLKPSFGASQKSLMTAYVLWWFGAALAAHRFYLGAFRSGLAMAGLFWGGLLLGAVSSKQSTMVGSVGIPPLWVMMILAWAAWCVVDAFLIPGLRRRHAEGRVDAALASTFA